MSVQQNVSAALELVIPTIRQWLRNEGRPVILGLTGLQGAGKSTWASAIVEQLRSRHQLRAIQVSLDDFYYPHETLLKISQANPENALLRTRGEPGTHDEQLACSFFAGLRNGEDTIEIPSFDKGAFGGEGDRLPRSNWPKFEGPIDVVVFEGWCLGFAPLSSHGIKERRARAKQNSAKDSGARRATLTLHAQHHLEHMDAALARYCNGFMGPQYLDVLIQLDTTCLENVYRWRLGQEHAMIARDGNGMTDSEVVEFIRGYMPAYELYLDGLREGFFKKENDRHGVNKIQLRVQLGANREVVDMKVLE